MINFLLNDAKFIKSSLFLKKSKPTSLDCALAQRGYSNEELTNN